MPYISGLPEYNVDPGIQSRDRCLVYEFIALGVPIFVILVNEIYWICIATLLAANECCTRTVHLNPINNFSMKLVEHRVAEHWICNSGTSYVLLLCNFYEGGLNDVNSIVSSDALTLNQKNALRSQGWIDWRNFATGRFAILEETHVIWICREQSWDIWYLAEKKLIDRWEFHTHARLRYNVGIQVRNKNETLKELQQYEWKRS